MGRKRKDPTNHYFYCNVKKQYYDTPKITLLTSTLIVECPLCGAKFENLWFGD